MFRSLMKEDQLEPMCLTYNTTFDLGDFHLSVLTLRHTAFKEKPVIPLAFMLHEQRIQVVHEFFFRRLKTELPQLNLSKRAFIL